MGVQYIDFVEKTALRLLIASSAFTSRRRMDFVQSAFAIANYTKLWLDNLLFPRKSWLAETTISCFLGEKLKHFIEKNSKWALDPTLKNNSNKHYIAILHHNIDILYFILFSNFIESGLAYRKCWLENLWSTQCWLYDKVKP